MTRRISSIDGHPGCDLDQAGLAQGEHPLADGQLAQVVGVAALHDEPLDLLGDLQHLVDGEAAVVAGPAARAATRGAVEWKSASCRPGARSPSRPRPARPTRACKPPCISRTGAGPAAGPRCSRWRCRPGRARRPSRSAGWAWTRRRWCAAWSARGARSGRPRWRSSPSPGPGSRRRGRCRGRSAGSRAGRPRRSGRPWR